MSSLQAIRWNGEVLELLDQRRLPSEWTWIQLDTCDGVAQAIADMVVRGAPAIAIAAAYGMTLAVKRGVKRDQAAAQLLAARPTAVNLRWALERLESIPDEGVEAAARAIHAEDLAINRKLGSHGAPLLQGGVLTICNTGSLATGGHGTALGMVRSALEKGASLHLFALETRPYLQGARLTVAECAADGIPCTLISDGMAGALMATGRIQSVVIGCDRVAANGDVANKIGSYQLAVLSRHHSIPFYVAMPTSTLDRNCPTGANIPIEERPADELRRLAGVGITMADAAVWNPAFDITPADLITAWVTEQGVWRTPFPTG
jgi:methylthioribose-1-phosphate isomerase